jgi:cytochrome c-type biogenesis protein CcmF
VRSGVLTSVHAFASDPERGVFILAILLLTIGGSLTLFALRAGTLRQGGIFAPISREGALVLNNLFLAAACAAVFVGTLYPLALETVTGAKISVGAPFFNLTVLPILVPLALLIPLGQALPWKRGDMAAAMQRIGAALAIALIALLAVFGWTYGGPVLAPLGIGLGAWVIAGTLADLLARAFRAGTPLSVNLRRFAGLPRAAFGTAIAHVGVGVTIIGLAATAWDAETIATMRAGDRQRIAGYTLRLDAVTPEIGANFRQDTATMTVFRGDAEIGRIVSAKRIYLARGMPTTEAGLLTRGFSQLYVSVGEVLKDRAIHVRLYHKPFVLLIWLGALVMALGGLVSLADRRMRIGVPQGRKSGAPAPVPAE